MGEEIDTGRVPIVVGYLRVSTEEQGRRKSPVATQRQVCRELCVRHLGEGGFRLDFESDEGLTGQLPPAQWADKGKHRPGLTRVVERVENGEARYIACQHVDRLARREAVAVPLAELVREARVKILTPARMYDLADPDDFFMFMLESCIGAHQPRITGVKSSQGKQTRARGGLPKSGSAPFGWTLQSVQEAGDPRQRKLVPVPEEGKWVQKAAQLYRQGWGFRRIAAHFAELGAPAPGETGWYAGLVKSLLANCKHAGLIQVAEGQYAQGKHFEDRCYDSEVFFQLQREMERRASLPGAHRRSSYVLTGMLRCGACGRLMRASSHSATRYYECHGTWREPRHGCPNRLCQADYVESVVLDSVRKFALSRRVQRLISEEVDELLSEEDGTLQERCEAKRQELNRLEEGVRWVISQAADNPDGREHFDREFQVRQQQIDRARAEHKSLRAQLGDVEQRRRRARRVYEIASDFDVVWASLEGDERKQVVRTLFDELALSPADGGSLLRLRLFLDEPQEVFIPAVKWARRPKHGVQALTHRERAALYLTGQRLCAREIAQQWGTSPGNVRTLLSRARRKLRVGNTQEAIQLTRDHIKELLPFLPLDGRIPTPPSPQDLTDSERKLLPDIADRELLYREIGERHGIAESTVKVHAANIARKLRARGRAELIGQVKRLRLLDGSGAKGNDVDE